MLRIGPCHLESCEEVGDVDLKRLFGTMDTQIFAQWFTGKLRVPKGELVHYVHMGYGSFYTVEWYLNMKEGRLQGQRMERNNALKRKMERLKQQWRYGQRLEDSLKQCLVVHPLDTSICHAVGYWVTFSKTGRLLCLVPHTGFRDYPLTKKEKLEQAPCEKQVRHLLNRFPLPRPPQRQSIFVDFLYINETRRWAISTRLALE